MSPLLPSGLLIWALLSSNSNLPCFPSPGLVTLMLVWDFFQRLWQLLTSPYADLHMDISDLLTSIHLEVSHPCAFTAEHFAYIFFSHIWAPPALPA